MDNTSGSEDRSIRLAEDIGSMVNALLEIIERLDRELTKAKDEIESLHAEQDERWHEGVEKDLNE